MKENEIQKQFEVKLSELRLVNKQIDSNQYDLFNSNNTQHIKIHFSPSESVGERNLISPNGNKVHSIGYFKLGDVNNLTYSDYYILAFRNVESQAVEYIIISSNELHRRIKSADSDQSGKKKVELVLWLMPDRSLYEVNSISPEGEWYFLSAGPNGRMADQTDRCYTMFLNNWDQLLQIKET